MHPARGAANSTLAIALVLSRSVSAVEPAAEVAAPRPARLSIALWRPMAIASQKLSDPRCAAILFEYRRRDGAPLAAALAGGGRTAGQHLYAITFLADSSGPCRRPEVLAWTIPGCSRVAICLARFESLSQKNPRLAATILIHELLHTLGLPEGPPSSESITLGVTARCGR